MNVNLNFKVPIKYIVLGVGLVITYVGIKMKPTTPSLKELFQ